MWRSLGIFGIAVGCVVTIFALIFFRTLGDNERIIIPRGYRGFVGIFYEEPSGVPLPKKKGWLIIDFPADGVIFTSSHLDTRLHRIEYYERDGHRLLPMRSNVVGPIPPEIPPTERIFTGGGTHTMSGVPAAVVYHVGDAADRAKLDWQSSDRWIQRVLEAKKSKKLSRQSPSPNQAIELTETRRTTLFSMTSTF